jgi:transposase
VELEELIVRLVAERDAAIQRQRELEMRNQELERQNKEMAGKLSFYEGSNVPPSVATLKKKKERTPSGKKRGAPKGHRGATRIVPPPEEIVDVRATRCPKCNGHPGKPVSTESRVVEDILPPRELRVKVTQYDLHGYRCQHCGNEFSTRHERCPQVGTIGPALLVLIAMLKFYLRGPIRRVQRFLDQMCGFDLSTKGVHDVLLRVAEACRGEYDRTLAKVRAAKWCYIDETGMKVLGKLHWLWIFRTDGGDVLVAIRPSRGRNVLEEILGKDFVGPAVADGWRAYGHIVALQRCWAHLIRVVDDLEEVSDAGKGLSGEIHAKFKDLKGFLDGNPSMEERGCRKAELDAGMEALVARYSSIGELEKAVTYISNGLGHWHTCLLYPGMEPTNNLGEQAMREHVIYRKIIGCFRSENGSQSYQYISSALATWRLQDKNMFEELEKVVVKELCLK